MKFKAYLNILAFVALLLGGNAIDLIGYHCCLRQNNKPVQGASQVNPTSVKTYRVIQGETYER
jgi:hypothetical protein